MLSTRESVFELVVGASTQFISRDFQKTRKIDQKRADPDFTSNKMGKPGAVSSSIIFHQLDLSTFKRTNVNIDIKIWRQQIISVTAL
jgi:hypothetical protein